MVEEYNKCMGGVDKSDSIALLRWISSHDGEVVMQDFLSLAGSNNCECVHDVH